MTLSKEHRAKIEEAIKETEYKYFGMYEFTEAQHDAVDLLVSVAQAVLDDDAQSASIADTAPVFRCNACGGFDIEQVPETMKPESIADTAGANPNERELFERWITTECNYDPVDMVTQPGGEVYVLAGVQEAWDAWMGSVEARAIAAPPAPSSDTAGEKLLISEDYARLCSSDWLKAISDSAPATPASSVADTAGREKELVEIIRRSHSSAASDNAAGASDKPLTDAQIEAGWRQTFSTENPYNPVSLKSFTKAVRWAEHAKESK